MDLHGWTTNSLQSIRNDGLDGARRSLQPVYHKLIQQGRRFQPSGDNIYDYDWDLLIVVDACRLDLMSEVASEYDYVQQVDDHWSVDSTTAFWMQRTFENQDASETTYICSNPFSAERLNSADFAELREVWRDVWASPGTVPPRPITDITIESMRNQRTSRTIAHYLQPHCPFIPQPELSKGKELEQFGNQQHRDVWERYRDGEIERHELWAGYRQNLEHVMDDIGLLLKNVSAETVVITSDHGNALGKWGIYGHPPQMPHHSLREVPWIETSAEDSGEHVPKANYDEQAEEVNREDQLKALGYV